MRPSDVRDHTRSLWQWQKSNLDLMNSTLPSREPFNNSSNNHNYNNRTIMIIIIVVVVVITHALVSLGQTLHKLV